MALYIFKPQNRPERVSRSEYLDEMFAKAIESANFFGSVSTVRGNFYESEIDRVLKGFNLSPTMSEKSTQREKQYYCSFKIAGNTATNVD